MSEYEPLFIDEPMRSAFSEFPSRCRSYASRLGVEENRARAAIRSEALRLYREGRADTLHELLGKYARSFDIGLSSLPGMMRGPEARKRSAGKALLLAAFMAEIGHESDATDEVYDAESIIRQLIDEGHEDLAGLIDLITALTLGF